MNMPLASLLFKMEGSSLTAFLRKHGINPYQVYVNIRNEKSAKIRAELARLANKHADQILADLQELKNA